MLRRTLTGHFWNFLLKSLENFLYMNSFAGEIGPIARRATGTAFRASACRRSAPLGFFGSKREDGVPRAAKNRGDEACLEFRANSKGGQRRALGSHTACRSTRLCPRCAESKSANLRVSTAWANACTAVPDRNVGAARLPTLRHFNDRAA